MNHTGKERTLVKTGLQDLVYSLVGMEKEAIHLGTSGLNGGGNVKEGETRGGVVALLSLKFRKVKGADINPWRSSGFHPGGWNSKRRELVGNSISRLLSNPASFKGVLPHKHFSVKEGSGGQNNRFRVKFCPCNCTNSRNF